MAAGESSGQGAAASEARTKFHCVSCNRTLSAPTRAAGKKFRCPACQTEQQIPAATMPSAAVKRDAPSQRYDEAQSDPFEQLAAAEREAPPQDFDEAQSDPFQQLAAAERGAPTASEPYRLTVDTKTCPFCGESIMRTAVKCKHCGEFLSSGAQRPTPSHSQAHEEAHQTSQKSPIKGVQAIGAIIFWAGLAYLGYWGWTTLSKPSTNPAQSSNQLAASEATKQRNEEAGRAIAKSKAQQENAEKGLLRQKGLALLNSEYGDGLKNVVEKCWQRNFLTPPHPFLIRIEQLTGEGGKVRMLGVSLNVALSDAENALRIDKMSSRELQRLVADFIGDIEQWMESFALCSKEYFVGVAFTIDGTTWSHSCGASD